MINHRGLYYQPTSTKGQHWVLNTAHFIIFHGTLFIIPQDWLRNVYACCNVPVGSEAVKALGKSPTKSGLNVTRAPDLRAIGCGLC